MAAEVKKEIALEIAHVLFIDIVAYSKMATDDQRAAVEKLNQTVQSTDEFRKAESESRLLKIATDDGMALIFYHSPEDPVECALEISRAIKEQHSNLQLRMGVHSGPVSGVVDVNGRANVAGAGINTAQRVMDCGDAGHILLSKRVAEHLEQFKHWRPHLYHLGECEVKHGDKIGLVNLFTAELGNSERPKRMTMPAQTTDFGPVTKGRAPSRKPVLIIAACLAVAVLAVGTFLFWHRHEPKTSAAALGIPEKSIAVMPFQNLSRDPDNAYFADGIQDEIRTRLSKIADLKVISRTSAQHYKSAPENLPEIGRQLGVAHILEGSVQKSGDAVRVNVQLIKAANDSHLWADTFDRKLTDIFSVESEVAKAIAGQLQARLTGQEEQVIAAKPTDNVEAYDAYLRGLACSLRTQRTPANSLDAQKYLREAVQLDPKFALAWALLSYTDAVGYHTMNLQPTLALREETRQAAETALTLQPALGEAVLAKGYYHYACLKDYDSAVRYLEQAHSLLPNNSRILQSLADVERTRGQWDRSDAYFNEAERLDPRDVLLLTQHALSLIVVRRFPEALRKLDQVLDITLDDVDASVIKATIAQAEGDLPRAAALLAPLHPNAHDFGAWEIRTYQAILERQPVPVIPRLKEILAEPDTAFGFLNGELRLWLGWAQEVAGDHAAAHETWRQTRSELEPFLKEQPQNSELICVLALANMGLGNKADALALAERAMAANPIERDVVNGPFALEILARVAAQTGESDRAIAVLQKLLSTPYFGAFTTTPLTPALLQLDPMFDPLRNDPRFQKLVASPTPKAADK
jgi:TolB-like protein/class 3 adenylate cyclase/cytochrome c-type biogenesis protein CcmH/NrfG